MTGKIHIAWSTPVISAANVCLTLYGKAFRAKKEWVSAAAHAVVLLTPPRTDVEQLLLKTYDEGIIVSWLSYCQVGASLHLLLWTILSTPFIFKITLSYFNVYCLIRYLLFEQRHSYSIVICSLFPDWDNLSCLQDPRQSLN